VRQLILSLMLSLSVFTVEARVEAYHFDDPAKEARYKQLIDELRCLVCQNQNLAASNAELAQDMRRLTYKMVSEIMLAIGVLVLVVFVRRRSVGETPELDAQDHERAKRLLDDKKI